VAQDDRPQIVPAQDKQQAEQHRKLGHDNRGPQTLIQVDDARTCRGATTAMPAATAAGSKADIPISTERNRIARKVNSSRNPPSSGDDDPEDQHDPRPLQDTEGVQPRRRTHQARRDAVR
jgi:hypothetical protein